MRFARGSGKFFKMAQFGVVWSIFCCNFVPKIVKMLDPAPAPPPLEKIVLLFGGTFTTFSLFCNVLLVGNLFHHVGTFVLLFLHVGGLFCPYVEFFLSCPSPIKVSAAPMYIDMVLLRTIAR